DGGGDGYSGKDTPPLLAVRTAAGSVRGPFLPPVHPRSILCHAGGGSGGTKWNEASEGLPGLCKPTPSPRLMPPQVSLAPPCSVLCHLSTIVVPQNRGSSTGFVMYDWRTQRVR
ncbi:MAG TPA: hypothetical protein VEC99_10665, partial [Clostridia bacterium]|nr:hypothetical protein [Clostridia bacterium]